MVKSQLQLSVLRFCRQVWKFVYKSKQPTRSQLKQYVRNQFAKHKNIPRMRFHQIQYRLRMGHNKFMMIKECGSIDGIHIQ